MSVPKTCEEYVVGELLHKESLIEHLNEVIAIQRESQYKLQEMLTAILKGASVYGSDNYGTYVSINSIWKHDSPELYESVLKFLNIEETNEDGNKET